jgi:hypothetical protein
MSDMTKEERKAETEREIFSKFANAANIGIRIGSIASGGKWEPDIRCEINGGTVWFELTEACDPEIARMIDDNLETADNRGNKKDNSEDSPEGSWVGDDTIMKKINDKIDRSKRYKVSEPIELLLHLGNRTVLTEFDIIATVNEKLPQDIGKLKRIWFFNEETQSNKLLANRY